MEEDWGTVDTPKNNCLWLERWIMDNLLPSMPPPAQSIYLQIYRKTLGWYDLKTKKNKIWDKISNSQFRKVCHIKSRNCVKRWLFVLELLDLIEVKDAGDRQPLKYKINVDELLWYSDPEYKHDLIVKLEEHGLELEDIKCVPASNWEEIKDKIGY